jgi:hypothetical protein
MIGISTDVHNLNGKSTFHPCGYAGLVQTCGITSNRILKVPKGQQTISIIINQVIDLLVDISKSWQKNQLLAGYRLSTATHEPEA